MVSDITIVCTESNTPDFKPGQYYRVGEWGYVLNWVITDDLKIFKKWDDVNSGLVAKFEKVPHDTN
nr:MAG TPA: hypothetical protein [Caudoviricetes sp.]